MSEEAKPAKKIKPPSASFLKSVEKTPSSEGMPVAAAPESSETAAVGDGPLGPPSGEEIKDDDLFVVPSYGEPEPATPAPPEPPAPPTTSAPMEGPPPEPAGEPMSGANLAERLAAELRELRDIVVANESLSYLRNRVNRALDEGADALTLVSFYRLVVRSLAEGSEQARRDYETMRSKANKLELELATSLANGAVSEASGSAAPAAKGISAEAQDKIARLEQEVAQVNEQREKLMFDIKNIRERHQKDLTLQMFREKESFFKKFLPVLDGFERANQSLKQNITVDALRDGMRLIGTLFDDALKAEGLEPIDTSGEFDPHYHEAVGQVENTEKPDGVIYDELARGYKLGERLIRAAMVRISYNPSGVIAPPLTESEASDS